MVKVEVELKNLILADYGKKNNVNVASLTQSEIKDIILGMEITTPNILNNNGKDGNNKDIINNPTISNTNGTTVTSTTVNKLGETITTQTISPYEQQKFVSKTDWRIKAISASNLYLRTNHIFVNSENIKENGLTYVLPKNLLKKFITIADLRTQIFGYIYGISPKDDPLVKEIHCIVVVPQTGTHLNVNIPNQPPEHSYLKDYEPLGWIHTQPVETGQLSAYDVQLHSKLLTERNIMDVETSIVLTCSFTQGSCTLCGYRLTPLGLDWGKSNKEGMNSNNGYSNMCYEKVQLLLSEKFMGFFMVPDNEVWNYNFIAVEPASTFRYGLTLANPKDYYNEIHRPSHFVHLEKGEEGKMKENCDVEDNFE